MTDLQEIGKTANSCWSQIYERMRLRSIREFKIYDATATKTSQIMHI